VLVRPAFTEKDDPNTIKKRCEVFFPICLLKQMIGVDNARNFFVERHLNREKNTKHPKNIPQGNTAKHVSAIK
jgi:hypothetical protein